ncbi:hypothetical protein [Marinomonas algarum]|uniref:Uncharacterized protein n=1 Tax=Marinomonas algarum TaxID=2883105 RepID=A0A9X1LCM8_9GAMM|nr:hypothetical protein [Marinomonas algarum]MCB5161637.1 hypothetical protein [Marinomonas algarum]
MRHAIHKFAMKQGNNPRAALVKMIQGGIVFVFGVLILMVADRVVIASLEQEIMALFGIILAGAGVIWTFVGYFSMSILRIYHMINKKD